MDDSDPEGFQAGAEQSKGDPRVVIALNAVLSTMFAATIAWGMGFVGFIEYNLVNTATIAILLFTATYVLTR